MKKLIALSVVFTAAFSTHALPTYDNFSTYGPSGTPLGGKTAPSGEPWVPYTNGPAGNLDGGRVAITNYFTLHADPLAETLPANFPGPYVSGLDTSAYSVWVPTNVSVASGNIGVGASLAFSSDVTGSVGQNVYASFFVDVPQVDPANTDTLFTGNSSTYYSWYSGFLPQSQVPAITGVNQNNPTIFERFNLRATSNNANTQSYFMGVGDSFFANPGTSYIADSGSVSAAHIYFVVIAYEWASTGTPGVDSERIWVDPAAASFGSLTEPTPTAQRTATSGYNLPDAGGFFFVTGPPVVNKGQTASGLMFNSLRVGTNWAYVTGGPQFTQLPQSTTNGLGGTAVFTGAAAAAGVAVSYQWQTNGVNVAGARVSGANSSALTISDLQASDAVPNYTLIASTPVNNSSKTNSPVTLTLADPWVIGQSGSLVLVPGNNAVFSVTAGGTSPFTYQWVLNGTPLNDGASPTPGSTATIHGSASAALTVADVGPDDSGDVFDCIVTNGAATPATATSTNVTLGVTYASIGSGPQSETVNYGATASFAVTVVGTGTFTYGWQYNNQPLTNGPAPNDPGATVSGATTAALSISHVSYLDDGSYSAVITNSTSQTAASTNAVLTVNDPYIFSQPSPVTLTNGSGRPAVFTVGANGSPTLGYSWIINGTALTDGPAPSDPAATVSGSATASLTIADASYLDAGNYSVIVTNGSGSPAMSAPAALNVVIPVTITNPPVSQTDVAGSEAIFTVGVLASSPVFQWQSNGMNIAGATTSVLSIQNVQPSDAAAYTVIVTNSISSNNASATLAVTTDSGFAVGDNLVGWWKFDDGSGLTAVDSSGYGNTAALQAFPGDNSEWVPGIFNDALNFLNDANVALIQDSPVLNFTNNVQFTLSAWINPSVAVADSGGSIQDNGAAIIAKGANSSPNPQYVLDLYYTAGVELGLRLLLFTSTNTFSELLSGAVPAQNVWTHVLCTYNGNTQTMSMYTNGVVVPGIGGTANTLVGTVTNAPTSLLYSTHPVTIGCTQTTGTSTYNSPFQGMIDDVRIYSYALTPDEVSTLYVNGVAASPPQITSVNGSSINNGQFTLNFTGPAGYNYRIWSTTDLTVTPVTAWTLVGVGTFTSGVNSVTDNAATDAAEYYTITVP